MTDDPVDEGTAAPAGLYAVIEAWEGVQLWHSRALQVLQPLVEPLVDLEA